METDPTEATEPNEVEIEPTTGADETTIEALYEIETEGVDPAESDEAYAADENAHDYYADDISTELEHDTNVETEKEEDIESEFETATETNDAYEIYLDGKNEDTDEEENIESLTEKDVETATETDDAYEIILDGENEETHTDGTESSKHTTEGLAVHEDFESVEGSADII